MAGQLPDLSIFLKGFFPGYQPKAVCSPFDACLELADWLLGPIDFKVRFVAASGHLESGYFVCSRYHELTGQSLLTAVNILLGF